ncbi:alpha/beta hydrolase [Haploplasma axanthum]|uniref:Lipase 2 n=1 Tax=Haploplasma axanthum TaxID=29552 RepID=A0A449BC99_HAPAX|nr:alpha/beta hydrolase [Haploplasma axanthum]VEU79940.1 Lipase 2 [Haploplasma axanthum]
MTEVKLAKGLKFRSFLVRHLTPSFKIEKLPRSRKLLNFIKGKATKKLKFEQVFIERDDKSLLRVCVYRPLTEQVNAPGIVWFHGGGYGTGIPEMDESRIKMIIEESKATLISVDYTLSFEKPYPHALLDAYLALEWFYNSTLKYNVNKKQIIVGGISAGGGLAAALTLYARKKGKIKIAFQMPLYPMLDDRMITDSSNNSIDPIWTPKDNRIAWDYYLRDFDRNHSDIIYAAPSRCEDLSNLPPLISYVGTVDTFYDETVLYVDKLRKAGVEAKLKVIEGACHAFDVLAPRSLVGIEANEFFSSEFRYALDNYFTE